MDEESAIEASKERKRCKGGQGGASQPASKRRKMQGDNREVRQDPKKRKRGEETLQETPS